MRRSVVEVRLLRYFLAVAEEGNIGRAAERLGMTQPPLSRALRGLETELGVTLYERTPAGVALTPAGEVLHAEAADLLERHERARGRVRDAAEGTTLRVGSLADTIELVGTRLVGAFRKAHPGATVTVHESDLGDPTAGLRSGTVDLALTREPFDSTGLVSQVLTTEPVGVVVPVDDPLCGAGPVSVDDLTDRRWIRLPDGSDPAWVAYWTGPAVDAEAPAMRTIQECLQAVLWNGMTALAPLDQLLPPGLVTVPVDDREPSRLVLAWPRDRPHPLAEAFAGVAVTTFGVT